VNPDRPATGWKLPRRKPYAKPILTCYGHVKDIVKGTAGPKSDSASASKACWIAEALYGVDAPRTLLVRGWLSEAYDRRCRWRFLISLYRTFGRRVAGLIQSGRLPARLFAPLFDALVVKANDDTARSLKDGRRPPIRRNRIPPPRARGYECPDAIVDDEQYRRSL
jgi:hypothetical protein